MLILLIQTYETIIFSDPAASRLFWICEDGIKKKTCIDELMFKDEKSKEIDQKTEGTVD